MDKTRIQHSVTKWKLVHRYLVLNRTCLKPKGKVFLLLLLQGVQGVSALKYKERNCQLK